jgi:hypothetical protein
MEENTPTLFAHTARQHISNLAEPKLLHRCHVAVHDRCESVPSRGRHTKPEAIARLGNKTFSFSKLSGDQSISMISASVSARGISSVVESHDPRQDTPRCRSLYVNEGKDSRSTQGRSPNVSKISKDTLDKRVS